MPTLIRRCRKCVISFVAVSTDRTSFPMLSRLAPSSSSTEARRLNSASMMLAAGEQSEGGEGPTRMGDRESQSGGERVRGWSKTGGMGEVELQGTQQQKRAER